MTRSACHTQEALWIGNCAMRHDAGVLVTRQLPLGQVTIQGNVRGVRSLTEALQALRDKGARRVLLPTECKRQLLEVPSDVVERIDPAFYSDPLTACVKALG